MYQRALAAVLHNGPPSADVLRHLSSRVDLLAYLLGFRPRWLSVAHLLNVIAIVKALVLDCKSSQMANIFRSGLPEALYRSEQAWLLSFAVETDDSVVSEALVEPQWMQLTWEALRTHNWLQHLG